MEETSELIGQMVSMISNISQMFRVIIHFPSIRKVAEQAMGNMPASSILHGLCISSCLQVPALFEFLFISILL